MVTLARALNWGEAHNTAAPETRGMVSLLPAMNRAWHGAAAAPACGRRQAPCCAARRVSAATALAERMAEEDMAAVDKMSAEETEHRRRSLEASFDQEATPDLFENGRLPDTPSASQQLEASWRSSSAASDVRSNGIAASNGATAANPAPSGRQLGGKRRASSQPPAALATSQDAADASDHQVLSRSMPVGSPASLRAARRHRDQGRVQACSATGDATPTQKQKQKQKRGLDRMGPAETFLQAMQLRLERSRGVNARRAADSSADAVTWYLQVVGSAQVLSRNEEMQLGAIIHLGNAVVQAAEELAKQDGEEPSLDLVAQHLGLRSVATLRQRLRNADVARDMMLKHNIRLVMTVVRQYTDRGVESADLLPAGIKGLERAIDRFDASKGFKFSTYAHWWIRQSVSRCVQENSRVVRLPVNVYELLSKINKTARRLNAQEGRARPATYNEIAAALKIPVAKVIQVVRAARDIKSLDTPTNTGGSSKDDREELLVDTLEDDVGANPEAAENRAVKEQVNQALKGLDLRPRNILRYRYGLHQLANGPLTLNQVGELYGLKGERVRQIEGLAMSMLKGALTAQEKQQEKQQE